MASSASFRDHYDADVLVAIDRLVSHVDMHPVWKFLATSPDAALPEHFVDACAVTLTQWRRMSKTPKKQMMANLAKIANQSERLATAMTDHASEIIFSDPSALTVNSFCTHRGASHHSAAISPTITTTTISLSSGAREEFELNGDAADEPSDCILVSELLIKLAETLRRPILNELMEVWPTKPNEASADRTFIVKSLTLFFLTHGGKPNAECVSRAVSALLDLDSPITSDHVAKLTKNLRKLCTDDAEDYRPAETD